LHLQDLDFALFLFAAIAGLELLDQFHLPRLGLLLAQLECAPQHRVGLGKALPCLERASELVQRWLLDRGNLSLRQFQRGTVFGLGPFELAALKMNVAERHPGTCLEPLHSQRLLQLQPFAAVGLGGIEPADLGLTHAQVGQLLGHAPRVVEFARQRQRLAMGLDPGFRAVGLRDRQRKVSERHDFIAAIAAGAGQLQCFGVVFASTRVVLEKAVGHGNRIDHADPAAAGVLIGQQLIGVLKLGQCGGQLAALGEHRS